MRARAHLATEHTGNGRTRISTHRSEAPLVLRSTLAAPRYPPWAPRLAGAAHVHLTAGAAGPIGGDHLSLRVDVGAGSALVLQDVLSTLLLPGPRGEQSRTRVDIHVAADATLVWLPEPVIAAKDCNHRTDVHVELDPARGCFSAKNSFSAAMARNPEPWTRSSVSASAAAHSTTSTSPSAPKPPAGTDRR